MYQAMNKPDLVAVWDIALGDGIHKIEFEHGTTSGKRVVYVDDVETLRKNWMFKLVGSETFKIGEISATINVDTSSGFTYEYTLEVAGKSLEKFVENRSKMSRTWELTIDGEDTRIVLEKDTMDVWVNGAKVETSGEFVDEGTETHFCVAENACYIAAHSSGKRKDGIIHKLYINDQEIPDNSSGQSSTDASP